MKNMKSMKSVLGILSAFLFLAGGSAYAQTQFSKKPVSPTSLQSVQQVKKTEAQKTQQNRADVQRLVRYSQSATSVAAPSLRLTETKAGKAEDKATITLEVFMDWGDGSGYLLLLDADANTYGTVIPASGPFSTETTADFSEFEYKIPEDAVGETTSPVILAGNSGTIEIEPGVYDWCVVNPTPGDAFWIASGEGRADDYAFEAGVEYVFTISKNGNYDNCVLSVVADYDIAMAEIIAPSNSADLTASEDVTIRFTNNGAQAVEMIEVAYSIDGGNWIQEAIHEGLEPDAEKTYTFSAKADLSAEGRHEIVAVAQASDNEELRANDTMRKVFWHTAPVELPFKETFDDATSFENYTLTPSPSEVVWEWNETNADPEQAGGSAYVFSYMMYEGEYSYMTMLNPVHMEAGAHNITFDFLSEGSESEDFLILYGKTDKVEDMQVLTHQTLPGSSSWQMGVSNFNIAEEGNYYFSFAAGFLSTCWDLNLDNISIQTGTYYGVPDLRVDKVILPISSCGLSDETIGVQLTNLGMGDITSFKLAYTVDNNSPVEQDFTDTIGIGATKTVYFTQTADFSLPEKTYTVKVNATVNAVGEQKPEDSIGNNSGQASVTNFTAGSMPFTSNFGDEDNWDIYDWAMENQNDWMMNSGLYWSVGGTPLYSRCLNLEANTEYRFTMNYMAGGIVLIWVIYDEFMVMYGESGTDISTWDTIAHLVDQYVETVTEADFKFTPETAGEYSFAIVPVTNNGGTLGFQSISISEVLDYDIKMTKFTGMPYQIPAEHVNTTFPVNVEVKNMGRNAVDQAKVTVSKDAAEVGSKEFAVGEPDTVVATPIDITLSGLAAGTQATLVAKAEIVGQTDGNADNELSLNSAISDVVLAYDKNADDAYMDENNLVGSSGYLVCGVPMYFAVKDTLTHISVQWGAIEADYETDIAIYAFDNEAGALGEQIYANTYRRGIEGGEKRYEVPALILEPGYYMIAVGVQGYALPCDKDPNGILYVISGGAANAQTNLGSPAIRAIFGHDGKPMTKDAYVAQILQPADEGLFATNEPIVVEIGSNGSEDAQVPVHVTVNGTALESQTVNVPAYGKVEVTFTADLSASSTEFKIRAYTALEGDEDPLNDTVERVVRSLAPADPYIMDFEYCADFAISGFNPNWRSVDNDMGSTYGFSGISFPHSGEPFGFIAFNPAMTEPACTPEEIPDLQPQNGTRFGAAFASPDGANDDWLISPALTLPATDASISLYVQTFSAADGYVEKYKVLVSATGELDDFTELHSGEAPGSWEEVIIPLDEFAGKSVYLAIQCVSNDQFIFMVDNIRVSKPAANGRFDKLDAQLSLYPNPAKEMIMINSTDARINQVGIFNLSGRMVYSSANLNTDNFRFNVSALSAGMYFARVKTDQGTTVMKFVVE